MGGSFVLFLSFCGVGGCFFLLCSFFFLFYLLIYCSVPFYFSILFIILLFSSSLFCVLFINLLFCCCCFLLFFLLICCSVPFFFLFCWLVLFILFLCFLSLSVLVLFVPFCWSETVLCLFSDWFTHRALHGSIRAKGISSSSCLLLCFAIAWKIFNISLLMCYAIDECAEERCTHYQFWRMMYSLSVSEERCTRYQFLKKGVLVISFWRKVYSL